MTAVGVGWGEPFMVLSGPAPRAGWSHEMPDVPPTPQAIDSVQAAIGGGLIAGGGGFFWWLMRGIFGARERAAEEFRNEVRCDLKELKGMVAAIVTAQRVSEQRHDSLEMRVASLERAIERLSEGR